MTKLIIQGRARQLNGFSKKRKPRIFRGCLKFMGSNESWHHGRAIVLRATGNKAYQSWPLDGYPDGINI